MKDYTTSSVSITKRQYVWLKDNNINLSSFVRQKIEEEIKNSRNNQG